MSEVVVATVESVVGTVIARDEDGNTRVLQPGDEIFYGEEVIAEDGAFIEMAFEDGSTMSLAGNESATITDDLAESAEPAPEEAEIADATVEEIIAALDRGEDITDIIEARPPVPMVVPPVKGAASCASHAVPRKWIRLAMPTTRMYCVGRAKPRAEIAVFWEAAQRPMKTSRSPGKTSPPVRLRFRRSPTPRPRVSRSAVGKLKR